MRRINKEFRQIDRLTDVLSFPMLQLNDGKLEEQFSEADLLDPGAANPVLMLGDILISVDMAAEQSRQYGHSLEREIGFLALHGLLHLLGYDHISPGREALMVRKQKKILDSLSILR
jgi:probable rRNA maturation factor